MAPSKKNGKLSRKKMKSNGKRRKIEKRIRPRRTDDIELYCVCRQPWDGNSLMVQCDQCQDWFHPRCVGVSRKDVKDNPIFICPQCHDKPVLKLTNYKMGSYSHKMQLSYYESLDPNRLYQMYSIPFMTQHPKQSSQRLHPLHEHELNAIRNSDHNDDMQFYRELMQFVTAKKNKIEIHHMESIHECKQYVLSALFAKYCDLMHNMNKSKPYFISKLITDERVKQCINRDIISNLIENDALKNVYHKTENEHQTMDNNISDYGLIDISTVMCLKCNGQIATNGYMKHIEQCYVDINVDINENKNDDTHRHNIGYDSVFESKYKSVFVPPNPYLNEDEESESDIDLQISVADIFDRRKVLKKIIIKKNKNKTKISVSSMEVEPTRIHANHAIFHKIYDTFYESNDDDDDDDDDDDIPIAQNIKDDEYKKLQRKFKRYYKENKIRKLKRKQKEFLIKMNSDKHKWNKYNVRIESDKVIINTLTHILQSTSSGNCLSLNKSKQMLHKLMECDIKMMKTKHCGILFPEKYEEHNCNEEKTMRMDMDENNESEKENGNGNGNDDSEDQNSKYLYFCHEKLNKNGLCPIHKNWRMQKYKELLFNLENEIQNIFLLNCTLKQIKMSLMKHKEKQKCIEKQRYYEFEQSLQNNLLFEHDLNPSISLKMDKQTDIHVLLNSMCDDDGGINHLQNIQNNAVLFP